MHVLDGRKSHEFANNTEWQPPVCVQNERYASSEVSVLISFARVSNRFCKFAVSSVTAAKKNGCPILPSWRTPGKSSPVGNASP